MEFFFSIYKSSVSGKENVFPDSRDFENLPDLCNGAWNSLYQLSYFKLKNWGHSTQDECRLTRQRAAELFPDEDFGEQLSDEALLALLEEHDQVVEQEILDEKIEDQDLLAVLEDPDFLTMDQVRESNDQGLSAEPSNAQTQTKVIVHTVWVLYGIFENVKLCKTSELFTTYLFLS